jgi:hypothetical protein
MRTHYLAQLPIVGRDMALALEPNFDFYRATRVLKLELELDDAPSLRLEMEYVDARRYRLALLFDGVRELRLPSMSPLLFLPELEVEDMRDRGLESIRFEAVSCFDRAFLCSCYELSIVAFDPG